eukprot:COSAG01_NODE_17_length_39991_cov_30.596160_48_plen_208_part_00
MGNARRTGVVLASRRGAAARRKATAKQQGRRGGVPSKGNGSHAASTPSKDRASSPLSLEEKLARASAASTQAMAEGARSPNEIAYEEGGTLRYTVAGAQAGRSLDAFLVAALPADVGKTRSRVQQAIASGGHAVTLNGAATREPAARLSLHSVVTWEHQVPGAAPATTQQHHGGSDGVQARHPGSGSGSLEHLATEEDLLLAEQDGP